MRLIDADALIHEYYKNPTYRNLCNAINSAPTIEPMQWIPCAVRLPEEDEAVLGTCISDSVFEPRKWVWEVSYNGDGTWAYQGRTIPYDVIAWQPKPEPYKGESDGE